jgi:signal transduction histidine kinase
MMSVNLAEALLNNLPMPVFAIDNNGDILDLNKAASLLLPTGVNGITGRRLDAVFPDWAGLLAKMKSMPQGFTQDIRLGDLKIGRAHVMPLPDYGWSIAIYDITSFKEAERSQTNLLGEVTHDLKQPISAILSFLDIIQSSGELNDQQKRFIGRIRRTATRMSEQVLQLLDVAWIESGMKLSLHEVDLVNLTRNIMDDLGPYAAEKHIRLTLEVPGSIPVVTGDNNRLAQAITNLLTNAIKYSPENTTVTVKIWSEPGRTDLSVSDQGIGIAPEHWPHLFDRFFRVKNKDTRRIEGAGLGLYITRSIIEQHGGQITVESTPGKGSTFTIFLPVQQSLATDPQV